jgi:hypothetical protein
MAMGFVRLFFKSLIPRRIVETATPEISDKAFIPPFSKEMASEASKILRCCSFSSGSIPESLILSSSLFFFIH